MTATDDVDAMQPLVGQPMRWNNVPELGDVKPLGEDDHPCLAEIRDVLSRHGKLDRFGLTLIHKHFEIGDDEVMIESNDPMTRTLTIRPVKRNEVAENEATVTNWHLTESDHLIATICICPTNYLGHIGAHKWVP